MDDETEKLISVIKTKMESMTNEERIELINSLLDEYCEDCGSNDDHCCCWNDE